jgi:hypothetical protein
MNVKLDYDAGYLSLLVTITGLNRDSQISCSKSMEVYVSI